MNNDVGHLCFCRRIQISGHSDFLEFSIPSVHLPFWLGFKRKRRLLLVLCILEVLKYCPWLVQPSLVELKILAQWILRTILNHLSQYLLGVRLDLGIFQIVVPTPNSWDDKDPFSTQKRHCSALIPSFGNYLHFVSDFRQLPCRYFLQFSQFFLHCCLCILVFSLLEA